MYLEWQWTIESVCAAIGDSTGEQRDGNQTRLIVGVPTQHQLDNMSVPLRKSIQPHLYTQTHTKKQM